ncbi:cell division cycle-associated protein 4 [Cervus canadensis]|uniref:cell division cycle-associated protein 4 n=1 Tax=Cervus canadensis TaxID=1574408 RepID=UPI001C9E38F1|nr:cell division cycle-associated protein 4 [Cervus canadensis]
MSLTTCKAAIALEACVGRAPIQRELALPTAQAHWGRARKPGSRPGLGGLGRGPNGQRGRAGTRAPGPARGLNLRPRPRPRPISGRGGRLHGDPLWALRGPAPGPAPPGSSSLGGGAGCAGGADAGGQGKMFARGLKRKRSEEEAPADRLQRQSLLDMSLVKLQLCHTLAEPSLCRSVLIANTVRQIQEEMTQDGSWRLPGPQAPGRAPRDRLVSTELLCRSPRAGPPSAPGPADLVSALQAAPAPGVVPGGPWDRAGPGESRGGFPRSLDQVFETLENHGPGAVEELFSDVDASYYDLDAVLTGMVGGAKSGPEGLESFASAAAPPPGAGCKVDLGELDHVVEILVET